jgi:hypothetical protein
VPSFGTQTKAVAQVGRSETFVTNSQVQESKVENGMPNCVVAIGVRQSLKQGTGQFVTR